MSSERSNLQSGTNDKTLYLGKNLKVLINIHQNIIQNLSIVFG